MSTIKRQLDLVTKQISGAHDMMKRNEAIMNRIGAASFTSRMFEKIGIGALFTAAGLKLARVIAVAMKNALPGLIHTTHLGMSSAEAAAAEAALKVSYASTCDLLAAAMSTTLIDGAVRQDYKGPFSGLVKGLASSPLTPGTAPDLVVRVIDLAVTVALEQSRTVTEKISTRAAGQAAVDAAKWWKENQGKLAKMVFNARAISGGEDIAFAFQFAAFERARWNGIRTGAHNLKSFLLDMQQTRIRAAKALRAAAAKAAPGKRLKMLQALKAAQGSPGFADVAHSHGLSVHQANRVLHFPTDLETGKVQGKIAKLLTREQKDALVQAFRSSSWEGLRAQERAFGMHQDESLPAIMKELFKVGQ